LKQLVGTGLVTNVFAMIKRSMPVDLHKSIVNAVLHCVAATVEKQQEEYQRNRRLSGIDLSRGALKPGGVKEKVLRDKFCLPNTVEQTQTTVIVSQHRAKNFHFAAVTYISFRTFMRRPYTDGVVESVTI